MSASSRPHMRRRPHPVLLVVLALTLVYGSIATWRRAHRPAGRWVGVTSCEWFGEPRITIRPGLRPAAAAGAAAHEAVHAAQCRQLGPARYRWRTMFAASNLALEAPAYCAGARARVRITGDSAFERTTIPIDMLAAMGDVVDSVAIMRALGASCPEFHLGQSRDSDPNPLSGSESRL